MNASVAAARFDNADFIPLTSMKDVIDFGINKMRNPETLRKLEKNIDNPVALKAVEDEYMGDTKKHIDAIVHKAKEAQAKKIGGGVTKFGEAAWEGTKSFAKGAWEFTKLIWDLFVTLIKSIRNLLAMVSGMKKKDQQEDAEKKQKTAPITKAIDDEQQNSVAEQPVDNGDSAANDINSGTEKDAANDSVLSDEGEIMLQEAANDLLGAVEKQVESPEFAQMMIDLQNGAKSPQEVLDYLAANSESALARQFDAVKNAIESELDDAIKPDVPDTALRRTAINEIISSLPNVELAHSTIADPQTMDKVSQLLHAKNAEIMVLGALKATLGGMSELANEGVVNVMNNMKQTEDQDEVPNFLKKAKFPNISSGATPVDGGLDLRRHASHEEIAKELEDMRVLDESMGTPPEQIEQKLEDYRRANFFEPDDDNRNPRPKG